MGFRKMASHRLMDNWMKFRLFLLAVILFPCSIGAANAGVEPVYTSLLSNRAISGYDAISYYEGDGPVKGSSDYMVEWKGAAWLFSSEANKMAFQANPEKYAPQYGGYCAWAVANGSVAKSDPLAFSLVDDKLYLNYNEGVKRTWSKDIPTNIHRGDKHWPQLLNEE